MAAATLINLASVVFLMVPVFIALSPGIGGGLGLRGRVVPSIKAWVGLALSVHMFGSFFTAGWEMKRCPRPGDRRAG